MSGIEHARLALLAAGGGDGAAAQGHISRARQQMRTAARRERQVVEIAALVVAGDAVRAAGLAYEHLADFPDDTELLAGLAPNQVRRERR